MIASSSRDLLIILKQPETLTLKTRQESEMIKSVLNAHSDSIHSLVLACIYNTKILCTKGAKNFLFETRLFPHYSEKRFNLDKFNKYFAYSQTGSLWQSYKLVSNCYSRYCCVSTSWNSADSNTQMKVCRRHPFDTPWDI